MPRGGRVKQYPEEFKQSAIEMALNSDQSISWIARDLGVSNKTLYGWVSIYRKKNDLVLPASKKDGSLEDELKRLRKENAKLRMEREILKKATAPQGHFFQGAYFAKDLGAPLRGEFCEVRLDQ